MNTTTTMRRCNAFISVALAMMLVMLASPAAAITGNLRRAQSTEGVTTTESRPGGWTVVTTTPAIESLLVTTLQDDAKYAPQVADRVCIRSIDAVLAQIVAGTNYLYVVEACKTPSVAAAGPLQGYCGDALADCESQMALVEVFSQPWTQTTQVTRIVV